jgi:hypothetical protein
VIVGRPSVPFPSNESPKHLQARGHVLLARIPLPTGQPAQGTNLSWSQATHPVRAPELCHPSPQGKARLKMSVGDADVTLAVGKPSG